MTVMRRTRRCPALKMPTRAAFTVPTNCDGAAPPVGVPAGRSSARCRLAAQDREGDSDAGGSVRLEQRVGVARGGVESLRGPPPSFPVQQAQRFGEIRPVQICVGCGPAGDRRGRDAHELGDGPLHVLLSYGDAAGVDGRHLPECLGEVVPPGVGQLGLVLEGRVG